MTKKEKAKRRTPRLYTSFITALSMSLGLLLSVSHAAQVGTAGVITVDVDDTQISAANVLDRTLASGISTVAITGTFSNTAGAIDISATQGGQTINTVSNDGRLRLSLPAAIGSQWVITATEQATSESLSFTLRFVADSAAPTISIDGALTRSTNTDLIEISGSVSDAANSAITLSVSNNRFANMTIGVVRVNDKFFAEIPLAVGDNALNIMAVDATQNSANQVVQVNRVVGLAPALYISSPQNGEVITGSTVNIQGTVYTTQAPEQVRISLGSAQQFAQSSATAGVYTYSFPNVSLKTGSNVLTVQVDTPAGSTNSSVTVNHQAGTTTTGSTNVPRIEILHPGLYTVTNGPSVVISGIVHAPAVLSSLSINGSAVSFVSQDNTYVTFQHSLDLSTISGELQVNIAATDALAQSANVSLTVNHDTVVPVINLSSPNLSAAPTVNSLIALPLNLQGNVVDATLAGFTINGNAMALLPGALADTYDFDTALNIPVQADQLISIEAWDQAGNRASQEYVVNANVPVTIDLVSPKEGTSLQAQGAEVALNVAASITGLSAGQQVVAVVDGGANQALVLDASNVSGSIQVPATDGKHTIAIEVIDTTSAVLASRQVSIDVSNIDNLPVAVSRHEPSRDATGIEPNAFVGMYFNKPIDPALLQVSVTETVHGLTYDLSGHSGASPLLAADTTKLVEMHKDRQAVAGGVSVMPGNASVAFYPEADFAYNASINVQLSYNNQQLEAFQFKVRPLPTFLQGFAADPLMQPIAHIDVLLPELNRRTTTNSEGSYTFGAGESAQHNLPEGRHRIVFNPEMKNPLYGSIENFVTMEGGRLNKTGLTIVPIINRAEPFRLLSGGVNPVILAGGDLQLDLTNASIQFPNGRSRGNVHTQYMLRQNIPYQGPPSITPQGLFALQPAGISVNGTLNVSIDMPALYGSFDYIPADGTLVLMIGVDNEAKQLQAIGIGRIAARQVTNVGSLQLSHLDYIGYEIKGPEAQAVMQKYETGAINFDEMKMQLDRLTAP